VRAVRTVAKDEEGPDRGLVAPRGEGLCQCEL